MKILERMSELRCNDFVCPSQDMRAHANASSVNVALGRAKIDTTFHGFRALMCTYCNEMSDFSSDIIEIALSHRTRGVRGAYLRSTFWDKRVELMSRWDVEATP